MSYVDFKEVSTRANIADVAALLGLSLKKSGEQLRGMCPVHPNGDRSLALTPSKGLWFCFEPQCRKGGDAIELVAKVRKCSQKEAAAFLAEHYGLTQAIRPIDEPHKLKGPLDYLQEEHQALTALGITPETCKHFQAGYAPKGIMRGRIAIPIHSLDMKLVAYCGRNTDPLDTSLVFPKDFEPEKWIWNAHALKPETAYIAKDPLHALTAYQSGIENVASFISPITQLALATLTIVLSKKGVTNVEIF